MTEVWFLTRWLPYVSTLIHLRKSADMYKAYNCYCCVCIVNVIIIDFNAAANSDGPWEQHI